MLVLDGKEVSNQVRSSLVPRIAAFKTKNGRAPHLAVIIVGEDAASQVYVRNKKASCEKIGMTSTIHALRTDTTQEELTEMIQTLNNDADVDGILVQFPLPKHLSSDEVLKTVSPLKDADGLTYSSLGYFFAGSPLVKPCTPQGVMTILKHYNINVEGMNAVVVGRSNIVGKPMAMLLSEANATVTICHSKTKNLSQFTRNADLVVVAAGKAQLLGKEDFKKDAIVVDVGMHGSGQGGKLCGDVRFSELQGWAKAATPVPGGVGPMTITTLLENTCLLAEKRANS
ncbi:bifunctional methylenetetrahydrofolate dehydrogenase/methenyltetrahydrofolate cyclohydrolase FolD [Bdellovibrio sp. SKB1291214]|uniref:bifunctional methylenetetrahydrofolate dehydrogenase/methenyltetrahydrofolate cyclohydrolase FolD n=1 Tax=Bdellovibrio sp. SKB1291214 TaxID=1732569 RepID=UPI000B51B4C9|nr:bifunctional methylenetetrahydrofolate dehydrogenase/methenyltetrahydrofolate cyclohydrolase FolD [Bdellovibrio sp. SKB1291214]UYL10035.1 bifunctional methylenetetrahydrofolate dehydrogenase/methenyltetrahydrofolate cyclohydrolase FolD [Bdellovibrio sp. SKB1291214]